MVILRRAVNIGVSLSKAIDSGKNNGAAGGLDRSGFEGSGRIVHAHKCGGRRRRRRGGGDNWGSWGV